MTAGPTSSGSWSLIAAAGDRARARPGRHHRAGRLPEDGADPRAGGPDRQDKATAEALKPWYNQFCKRPCFHDEYLQAFNRPNVHAGATPTDAGVERSPRPA